MLVPIKWLKDYVEVNTDIDTYCDKMIMSGSNLETVSYVAEDIQGVVVGKILKIEKHPEADLLVVCTIDVGSEKTLNIVTGAPNIFENALIPVALDGAKVPGPLHGKPKEEGGTYIRKGVMRGIESEGMLCSAEELGFEDKVVPVAHKDGIWILEGEHTLGMDIVEALELKEMVVDFEITPNRPDCLSMLGMARETAATFGEKMQYPDTKCVCEGKGHAADYISVEIKKPDLCKRYIAKIITDVKIEQSPWWMQKRLMNAGMRPINNIVDISNFVMLEYGQPLHAFDISTVKGRKIVVDTAVEGEIFTTLNNKEKVMSDTVLMIKDAEAPIGIAGIMGGLNSEIEVDTKEVILESANFLNDNIRASAKKLGYRTEASARYEKGIDPNLCEVAAERFCKLVEILGAGKVVAGSVDVYPEIEKAKPCKVRVSRVNHVLGAEIPREKQVRFLELLEMTVEGEGDIMIVTPPTIRRDLAIEDDYIEEIGRLYGYDVLPNTIPSSSVVAEKPIGWQMRDLVRGSLISMGFSEIQTYSFVSPKGVDNIKIPADSDLRKFVTLLNPLGEDTSVMRTTLIPGMLEVLGRNFARNCAAAKAFEIGNTFILKNNNPDELPEEKHFLCVGMYGAGVNFFVLKGIVEETLFNMGIRNLKFVQETENETYHTGRCANIFFKGILIGTMGEVYPEISDKYGIGERCYVCEANMELIGEMSNLVKFYSPLPKYPSTSRDIALLVSEEVTVGALEKSIKEDGGTLLESVKLFDVYRGMQVATGKKSIAFSLTYRAADKTLTDDDVREVHAKVLENLAAKFDAVLREM